MKQKLITIEFMFSDDVAVAGHNKFANEVFQNFLKYQNLSSQVLCCFVSKLFVVADLFYSHSQKITPFPQKNKSKNFFYEKKTTNPSLPQKRKKLVISHSA